MCTIHSRVFALLCKSSRSNHASRTQLIGHIPSKTPTKYPTKKNKMLLDYAATYPNAIIRYYANVMILHIDFDVVYLVMPNAKSCIAGHYFLSDYPSSLPPMNNGPGFVQGYYL